MVFLVFLVNSIPPPRIIEDPSAVAVLHNYMQLKQQQAEAQGLTPEEFANSPLFSASDLGLSSTGYSQL